LPINLIAACDYSNAIGYKNDLLVKLPEDMKNFQKLTTGHFVVMGSNTFRSIGSHLKNRQNLVITSKTKHDLPDDVYAYHSVKDVLFEYEHYAEKQVELWVIGGQSIYEQFLPHADKIYLTIIEHTFPKADTFFPRFSLVDWKVIDRVDNKSDEKHPYNYSFVTYERRNKDK
jgi:dihydrofolate reductase